MGCGRAGAGWGLASKRSGASHVLF
jgi:hypothetical protein